jgi:hypothetical protein
MIRTVLKMKKEYEKKSIRVAPERSLVMIVALLLFVVLAISNQGIEETGYPLFCKRTREI